MILVNHFFHLAPFFLADTVFAKRAGQCSQRLRGLGASIVISGIWVPNNNLRKKNVMSVNVISSVTRNHIAIVVATCPGNRFYSPPLPLNSRIFISFCLHRPGTWQEDFVLLYCFFFVWKYAAAAAWGYYMSILLCFHAKMQVGKKGSVAPLVTRQNSSVKYHW